MSSNVVLAALPHLDVATVLAALDSPSSSVEPHHAQAHDVDGNLVLTSLTPFSASTIKALYRLAERPVVHIAASDDRQLRLWQVYSGSEDRMWIWMDGEVQIDEGAPHRAEAGFEAPLAVGDLYAMVGIALDCVLDPRSLMDQDAGTPVLLPR